MIILGWKPKQKPPHYTKTTVIIKNLWFSHLVSQSLHCDTFQYTCSVDHHGVLGYKLGYNIYFVLPPAVDKPDFLSLTMHLDIWNFAC